MANDLMEISGEIRVKLQREFGPFAPTLPASIVTRLAWHRSVPEYSTLGWPTMQLRTNVRHQLDRLSIPEDDVKRALVATEMAMTPSGPAQCLRATARLRAVARIRPTVEADDRLALAVYAEKLAAYPEDAVAAACERWLETSPFWPAVSELLQACEWAMQPRRALASLLREIEREQQDRESIVEAHTRELVQIVQMFDSGMAACSPATMEAERELAKLQNREPATWALPQ